MPRTRSINSVFVLCSCGVSWSAVDVDEVVAFIEASDESKSGGPFARYEVGVRYSNGDEVRGQFTDKATAVAFLRSIR